MIKILRAVHSESNDAFTDKWEIINVVSDGKAVPPVAVNLVRIEAATVKFATNRVYQFKNIDASFQGDFFVQGDNDKGTGDQGFTTNFPVTVYAVMDSRVEHAERAPEGFVASGATMDFTHEADTLAFPLYEKDFGPGSVTFQFREGGMNGIIISRRVA